MNLFKKGEKTPPTVFIDKVEYFPESSFTERGAFSTHFWQIIAVGVLLFFLLFHEILLPFFIGFLIAYFLNPLIAFLARLGISRLWGTVFITIFILLCLVVVLTILVPVITWQLQQFVTHAIPIYIEDFDKLLQSKSFFILKKYFNFVQDSDVGSDVQAVVGSVGSVTKSLMSSVLSSGKSLLGSFSLIIIAPVVAFYLLIGWDNMVANIDDLIPRKYLFTIRDLIKLVDKSVAGFVRGQSTVSLILGLYYALALSCCGLNYAILLGLYIGFASFIPYIGTASGFLIAFVVAWAQYYEANWYYIGLVVGVFLFGHFVESYILQPKLVGNSVGLHPVWLMFALVAFGYLFGFVGMLIAVPSAAAIGVIVRYFINYYKNLPLYTE